MQRTIARNQHYVPQSYLGLFTNSGDKFGRFHVLPTDDKKPFFTSPRNVAAERDFNKIDVEGYPPDYVESGLAPMEGGAVDAIRFVAETLQLPDDRRHSYLLNLACLLFVRNAARRAALNAEREHSLKGSLREVVRTPEAWHRYLKHARSQEPELAEVSFERASDFIENERFRIVFPDEDCLRAELKAFDSVLQLFAKRVWSLLVAPNTGSRFICCDNPVSLVATKQMSGKISLDTPNTEVFWPLTPNLGLVGVLEEQLLPTIQLKPHAVGVMNRRTVRNAYRYVFSKDPSFAITSRNGMSEVRIRSS